jgi:hypothetical protein
VHIRAINVCAFKIPTGSSLVAGPDARFPLTQVNGLFAKMHRDRAALVAQGWRAGNFALILLQALIARAVEKGALSADCVRQATTATNGPLNVTNRAMRGRSPTIGRGDHNSSSS